jgi:replicative DNA helicase
LLDRVPPQNVEAEQSVLGAMLIEREAISRVAEFLQKEDFYREAHRLIYDAIIQLYNKNEAVDLITITEQLKKEDKLEAVGGISYISSLANSIPTAANVIYHARIIEEKALLRQLINAATHIAGMGYEANDDVVNVLDQAEKMILGVSNRKVTGEEYYPGCLQQDRATICLQGRYYRTG